MIFVGSSWNLPHKEGIGFTGAKTQVGEHLLKHHDDGTSLLVGKSSFVASIVKMGFLTNCFPTNWFQHHDFLQHVFW